MKIQFWLRCSGSYGGCGGQGLGRRGVILIFDFEKDWRHFVSRSLLPSTEDEGDLDAKKITCSTNITSAGMSCDHFKKKGRRDIDTDLLTFSQFSPIQTFNKSDLMFIFKQHFKKQFYILVFSYWFQIIMDFKESWRES